MKTISSFSSKLLAFTLALMASVSTFAYDFQSGYLFYNILPDGTVAVTSETYGIPYDYLPNSLVIPSEVNGYNGETYVVTEIANYAFSGCSMLDTLVIPNTVKKIGMYAFTGCTKLVYISFPESIEDILGGALYECAWYNNQPDGLIYIGNLLYRYKGTAPTGTIVVKDGTKAILDFTFSNQPNIQSVVLPESVTSIHIQAFGDCPNLESVVLPSKLEAIEDHTFQYCEKLTNIKLPDALKLIGKNAFIGCTNLTKLTLPSSVQIIEDEAFANCTSLTEVTCYATIPPVRGDVVSDSPSDWFFAGVDVAKIPLYVPTESIDLYKKAEQWMFFNPILPIEPTTDYKSQWCDTWNMLVQTGSIYPPLSTPYRYQLAKDTVIGDYTYTAIVSKAINDALDAPHYVAAVRFTDDRKVYIYYDNAEYLLYDFNVQQGDELEVFAGINNYRFGIKTYKCIVTGVEQYACIGCPATITLHVPNHPDDFTEIYRRTQWQEGVGDVYSGFLNGVNGYVPVDGGGSVHLLCAYQGDELKHTGPLHEEYGCGDDAEQSPEDLFPTLWGLQRTEVEYHTDGADAPSLVSFEEYTPTLVNGKWYLYDGRNYLREENSQVLLYSPEFEIYEDVVLYDWTLEIGDTLPFTIRPFDDDKSRGAVFRVTDVSTITLLDGKEYKKWTLACGIEYIEGIGAINGEGFGNYFCIQHTAHPATYINTRLVCASRNGQLLYQMDDAEMERLGAECLCDVETSYKSLWCDTWNVLDLKYRTIKYTTKEDFETWRYYLAQDTIINNYTYTAVTRQTTKVPEGVYPFTIPEPEYVAAVRFTDDSKVYIYYDNTEYLLYDFNVQPGDELTVFAGINHYHSHHTNTIRVAEVERYPGIYPFGTEISLSVFPDFYGDERPACFGVTKWVEGVGDLCGFITGADCGLSEYQTALLCAYKDGNTEYTTENEEYAEYGCEYNSGENKEYILTLPGLQRTSCTKTIGEDEYGTVWGSRSYLMQEIETATIDGKQYLLFGTNNIYDEYCSLWLREENNKILLYSTAQKKDLVLYDFTLNVGDSLPRLYVDYDLSSVVDYDNDEWGLAPLVVTEVSTITLLDGKEYKKWTFDNGMQYVEGIGSFGTCYAHNDFYQLIANAPRYSDVYSQHLVCTSRNGQLLYQMDASEMEQLETECLCEAENPEDLFPTLLGLQRTVCNEYCGDTEDDNSANNTYKQTFDSIFFENDKPYILCNDYFLREEDNKILIYSQLLNKDLVLYDFTLEVGDSLPALYIDYYAHNAMDWMPYNPGVVDYNIDHGGTIYPADTFIVTNISTVTLLDGKEYKKWTFNNGMEYVEGIGMYGGHRNGDFFGLIQEIVVPCHTGTHLVCVSKNNKLLYQMDEAEMDRLGAECLCDYDRGPRKDNAKDGQIGGRPTPTQWNQLELDLREMENGTTILRAETFSYTLEDISQQVNNKTYFQLARQSTKDTATTKSVVGALHFGKDEDNRVYFLRDGVEYVLYDFTAEIGDTVEIFAGINNYPQETTYTHVVVDKDTTEDGACRMFLEVVFPEETTTAENAEKVWLAGLGSVDGIVHNAAKRTSNAHAAPSRTAHSSDTQTSVMLCAWREDSCLYTTDHPDYNDIGCIYNQDPTSIEDTHSPSPMADYQKLLRDGQLLIIHKGKTYNVLGVQIK